MRDSARRDSTAAAVGGTTAVATRASGDTTPPRVLRHDVIARGTHGMSSRVRWTLSPDRLALVVMEDPTAVEAEPVPNGVVYASETRSAVVQLEDVWDATPSPDWRYLAFGRAFVLRGEHRDTLAAKRWGPVAARFATLAVKRGAPPASEKALAREYERRLRRESFPVSGMSILYGVAATYVIALDSLPTGARAQLTDTVPPARFGGWRVRWLPGDTLAVGGQPSGSQDASPSSSWTLVRVAAGDSLGAPLGTVTDSTRFAPVGWQNGPTLDMSVPLDIGAARTVDAGAARIESRGGTIYLSRRGESAPIVVGPGIPLAATANGRFIVAIAPRAPASGGPSATAPGESASIPVVYEVIP